MMRKRFYTWIVIFIIVVFGVVVSSNGDDEAWLRRNDGKTYLVGFTSSTENPTSWWAFLESGEAYLGSSDVDGDGKAEAWLRRNDGKTYLVGFASSKEGSATTWWPILESGEAYLGSSDVDGDGKAEAWLRRNDGKTSLVGFTSSTESPTSWWAFLESGEAYLGALDVDGDTEVKPRCNIGRLAAIGAEEKKPLRKEKLSDRVTRLVHADSSEEWWDVAGRGKVQFIVSPAQTREEPEPRPIDVERGYIIFSPEGRGGVLPEYRPTASEISDKTAIFAASGEFEPATFAIRPLKDLGTVKFSCGDLIGQEGTKIPTTDVNIYIMEPTIEQIEVSGPKVRWMPKWLRPGNTAVAVKTRNVQVYVDVHVPIDTKSGVYKGAVAVKPERGKESSFTVELEILPLELERPMPWGSFNYDWTEPEKRGDRILWMLKEMRRAGMTQCVISPIHYQNRPGVNKDGTVDFSVYDRCVNLYHEAGFEDPPIIAMEGLMQAIVLAMGKENELKFTDTYTLSPDIKADEVPADVREFAGRVIKNLYQHSLEAKWHPFYIYFADEPNAGANMEKAKFMYKLTREVASGMKIASTVYGHDVWKSMNNMIDLNITHYVHPCNNVQGNQGWHEMAHQQNALLYGIGWLTHLDTFRELRNPGFLTEKCNLDGVMLWTQWIYLDWGDMKTESFNPYAFLWTSWKGGPWFIPEKDGRVWRSISWLGLREAIDDSKYVRTLRKVIDDASKAGKNEDADRARMKLEKVLNEVPWGTPSAWTASRADAARRELAEAAIECRQSLDR